MRPHAVGLWGNKQWLSCSYSLFGETAVFWAVAEASEEMGIGSGAPHATPVF